MRSSSQQLVTANNVVAFSATSKKQGATRKKKIQTSLLQQNDDDWTMDDILKPKKNSIRNTFIEKYYTISYRTSKKKEGKQSVKETKKPKCSVRFDMDRNTVTYRHATIEDLKNAWISPIEFKAIGNSVWSTIMTINELAIKNKGGGGSKMIPTSTNMIEYIHSTYGGYDTDELCLRGLEFHVSPRLQNWKKENRARIRQTVLSIRGEVNRKDITTNDREPQQNVVDTTSAENIDITAFSESLLSKNDELHALQKAMIDSVDAQFIHSKNFQGSRLMIK